MEPVRQFHPSRETPYSKGHTSSVSHTRISRKAASAVSRNATSAIYQDVIIIKRPRKSILEQETYALVSFITELRVRTHAPLREHPNIAQLRGVGWDFEDEAATIPRPLLLEELAPQGALNNFWARWNFVPMHDCGVVHGDVKPENILIFPRMDTDNEFVAKLTDFGHSVFEYSHSKSPPAFTPQWCAPELSPEGSGLNPMGFRGMQLTDVYSYGLVILSIMIERPFHESIDDFKTPKSNGTMLTEAIELVSREDRDRLDSDLDLATIELLMRQTIRLRPKHRNLEKCIKIMNNYDKIKGHKVQNSSRYGSNGEQAVKELNVTEMVAIGHSTFSRISHQLKAHIVESLLRIAKDSKDLRRLAAAWELSVCYFARFSVEKSFEHCSEWLSIAFEGGVAAAQDYFAILHEAMNRPYQVPLRKIKQRRIPATAVSEHQSAVQDTEPRPEDLDCTSLQGSDYESDAENISKSPTHATTLKRMPNELLDILNAGTLQGIQRYLEDSPEDLNGQDVEGNTPLMIVARRQQVGMLKFLVHQEDVDAGIPNRFGHTVLHFLSLFDDETVQDLVPKLAQRRADLRREALAMPLGSEDVVLTPEIRCCSILNAILHSNLILLKCLLEASHANGTTGQCHICEGGSRFRRIIAISLSIFQAGALAMLLAHVRDRGNLQDIGLKNIKVWAGSKLLPLHKVPFNSVALRRGVGGDSHLAPVYGRRCGGSGLFHDDRSCGEQQLGSSAVLLDEGEKRRFTKSWWLRSPFDNSPFMRSISLGFREIFKLFLKHDPTLLHKTVDVACRLSYCPHCDRKRWYKHAGVLLGHSGAALLPQSERKHVLSLVQLALWLLIDSSHQDYFFVLTHNAPNFSDAILDAADPELIVGTKETVTLFGTQNHLTEYELFQSVTNGTDFLEHAILSSVFSPAATIIDRFPDVFRRRSRWSYLCVWRSMQKSKIRDTSRASILRVLRRGSYRQCRFIMERLLPLRTGRSSSSMKHESRPPDKYNVQEDGVQEWTRCPLSREEYHLLVMGNIRTSGSDRKDLWNVAETQAKLGHSRSVFYLRQAILYGNPEALEDMLQRGWDPNGPLWTRLQTPLQYSQSLTSVSENFNLLFVAWNPDLHNMKKGGKTDSKLQRYENPSFWPVDIDVQVRSVA
ncbi:hypothetical protein F4824DRAFT_510307 [Ustulina deusta]|nr:hypothetical protein F4824DRAFT_510307 [Ustulina deusta]